MNNIDYNKLLWILIADLAKQFSEKRRISLEEANNFIYNSTLYQDLNNDDMKMWYYSTIALNKFLNTEYETGSYIINEN